MPSNPGHRIPVYPGPIQGVCPMVNSQARDSLEESGNPTSNQSEPFIPTWTLATNSSERLDPIRTPSEWIDPTRTPSELIDPTRTPSALIDPTRTPSAHIDPTRSQSAQIDQSRSPLEWIYPTQTPSEWIYPTQTLFEQSGPIRMPWNEQSEPLASERLDPTILRTPSEWSNPIWTASRQSASMEGSIWTSTDLIGDGDAEVPVCNPPQAHAADHPLARVLPYPADWPEMAHAPDCSHATDPPHATVLPYPSDQPCVIDLQYPADLPHATAQPYPANLSQSSDLSYPADLSQSSLSSYTPTWAHPYLPNDPMWVPSSQPSLSIDPMWSPPSVRRQSSHDLMRSPSGHGPSLTPSGPSLAPSGPSVTPSGPSLTPSGPPSDPSLTPSGPSLTPSGLSLTPSVELPGLMHGGGLNRRGSNHNIVSSNSEYDRLDLLDDHELEHETVIGTIDSAQPVVMGLPVQQLVVKEPLEDTDEWHASSEDANNDDNKRRIHRQAQQQWRGVNLWMLNRRLNDTDGELSDDEDDGQKVNGGRNGVRQQKASHQHKVEMNKVNRKGSGHLTHKDHGTSKCHVRNAKPTQDLTSPRSQMNSKDHITPNHSSKDSGRIGQGLLKKPHYELKVRTNLSNKPLKLADIKERRQQLGSELQQMKALLEEAKSNNQTISKGQEQDIRDHKIQPNKNLDTKAIETTVNDHSSRAGEILKVDPPTQKQNVTIEDANDVCRSPVVIKEKYTSTGTIDTLDTSTLRDTSSGTSNIIVSGDTRNIGVSGDTRNIGVSGDANINVNTTPNSTIVMRDLKNCFLKVTNAGDSNLRNTDVDDDVDTINIIINDDMSVVVENHDDDTKELNAWLDEDVDSLHKELIILNGHYNLDDTVDLIRAMDDILSEDTGLDTELGRSDVEV